MPASPVSLPRRRLPCAASVLVIALALLLGACAAKAPTHRGEVRGEAFELGQIAQSDTNRVASIAMRDNLDGLVLLLGKLYLRNPVEWRKTARTREDAIATVRAALDSGNAWPPLAGARDIAALSHALSPEFSGDRAAAFIHAAADMLITAHGGKRDIHLIDGLDPQRIYNAARNMETALWILNTRRDAQGQPLLRANELGSDARNLSFEREFGKIIGRLDLLARVLTESYRRAGISYVQNLIAAPFLVFLPVR